MSTYAVIAPDFGDGMALAHRLSLTIPETALPGLHLVERATPDRLRDALAPPQRGLVESATPWQRGGIRFLRHLEQGGIGLALTTASAYALDLAPPFAQAVQALLNDHGYVCPADLELVIHEALSNALIHGNLGVDATTSGSVQDMLRFGELVEDALADPARAGLLVWLSARMADNRVQIAIEDQGAGFAPAQPPSTDRPHGLDLIAGSVRGLRRENDGRTLVLELPLEQRDLPRKAYAEVCALIVDDNPFNAKVLEALLRSLGVGCVHVAQDGVEGLKAIHAERPDIVLLDVMMPRMDGLEMCRRLRQTHTLSDLPVLFITALDDAKSRTACFSVGGNDVISKPIDTAEVLARVRVHLQNSLLLGRLNAYHHRVRDELETARQTQASLVPTQDQLDIVLRRTGLSIRGVLESSSELGGDFWTTFDAGPRRVGIVAADCSGHGVAAAFNVFRLHVLLNRLPQRVAHPALLMTRLNRELKPLLKPGQFAALFIAIIDLNEGILRYCGAATTQPVLVPPQGPPRLLDIAGPPLGAFADAEYDEWDIAFPTGSSLLVYSDALTESMAAGRLVCDEDTLLAWVAQAPPGQCLADHIQARFHAVIPGDPPDDLTLLHVLRQDVPPPDDQENAAAN